MLDRSLMPFTRINLTVFAFVLTLFSIPLVVNGQSQGTSKTVLDKPSVAKEVKSGDRHITPPVPHEDAFESGRGINHYHHYEPIAENQAAPSCSCSSCIQQNRRCRKGCGKKPAVGRLGFGFAKPVFPVEEVQYGANAGLPSFGLVSHGPWYNGETRELFPKRRHSCRAKFRLKGQWIRGSGYSACGNQRCDCEHGCTHGEYGEVYESPMTTYDSFGEPTLSSSNAYPLESTPETNSDAASEKK